MCYSAWRLPHRFTMRSYGSAALILISVCTYRRSLADSCPVVLVSSAGANRTANSGRADTQTRSAQCPAKSVATAVDEASSGATFGMAVGRSARSSHAALRGVCDRDGQRKHVRVSDHAGGTPARTDDWVVAAAGRLRLALVPRHATRARLSRPEVSGPRDRNAGGGEMATLDRARAAYVQGLELESKGSHEPIGLTSAGPNAYDKAGARAGYFAQAGELFTRALQQRPDLTAAALHLGRIRMLQGNGGQARRALPVGPHRRRSSCALSGRTLSGIARGARRTASTPPRSCIATPWSTSPTASRRRLLFPSS